MELHRITSPEDAFFPAMFALYEASFPLSERRARPEQERLLAQRGYFCTAILVDGQFAGLFCWWELDGTCYAEHLATLPALRGQGLGRRAMELLQARGLPIFLEIDPPEDEISRRRQGFYQRMGFLLCDYDYHQAPYRLGMPLIPLRLLSWPEPLADPAGWEARLHQLLRPFASPMPAAE